MRVVLATSNAGKIREASRILAGSDLEVVTEPMWLGEIEAGTTFRENAFIKASSAARLLAGSGRAVLAEDSGLEVDALDGLPGVHSARFAGPNAHDSDNTAKLLELLSGIPDGPDARRSARYHAVAVLIVPSGAEIVGEGVFEGSIAREPRGERGFGYDPVFVPAGESRTAAELSDDEKDRLSHRAQSLRAILTRTAVR